MRKLKTMLGISMVLGTAYYLYKKSRSMRRMYFNK